MSSGPTPIYAPGRQDSLHTCQLQGVLAIAASRNLGITAGGKRIWALASKMDRPFTTHSVLVTATDSVKPNRTTG